MRIGFFSDSYLPVRHGVQVSIDSFRKCLKDKGHQVFIYTTSFPHYKETDPEIIRLHSFKVIPKPEMRVGIPIVQKGKFDVAIKNELDIAHAHTPFSLGLFAKYISKLQRIPMVYTHHTHYVEYAKSYFFKEKYVLPFFAKQFTKWFCSLSDAVIAPSEKIKRMLLEDGVKKRIYVLPTGIPIDSFKRTASSKERAAKLRASWGIETDEKVLLSLGRIGKEKNLDFMISAYIAARKLYPKLKLVIAGDGPYAEKLKKWAQKTEVGSIIIFTGFVPQEEKGIYYQAADIFVFASITDTQGIVILEAAASGLPIVAVKDDAWHGNLIDGKNGFSVKGVLADNLGAKIAELAQDSARLKSFGETSLKIADEFSEEKAAEKLLRIYASVMKNRRA